MTKYYATVLLILGTCGCIATSAPKAPALLSNCTVLECVSSLAAQGFTRWGCNSTEANVTWTPPDSGSAVVYYVLEMRVLGIAAAPPQIVALPTWADTTWVRCAGVDSLGRQGPFSEWSEGYD